MHFPPIYYSEMNYSGTVWPCGNAPDRIAAGLRYTGRAGVCGPEAKPAAGRGMMRAVGPKSSPPRWSARLADLDVASVAIAIMQ